MKARNKISLYVIVLSLIAILSAGTFLSMLSVGDKAPAFTVAGLDRDSIRLSDYKGKLVILHLWSPTCPHCREANQFIPIIMAPYKDENIAYIMVAIDMDTSTLRPVIKEDKLNFAIHGYDPFDGAAKTMLDYKASGTPSIQVIDEKGKILAMDIGYKQLKKFLKKQYPTK
ncbi:TlpA disulfide reductase family protein [uncultured Cytophaga sp.]|uniref:TlpA family protein disulfide reductase n=1 Tax=uncultured Cytophaga sp. TaxID=160238 RepID=UPI002639098B|nr:TlpA disulfide reductase family protein [uncultured Cytophaga sp.]